MEVIIFNGKILVGLMIKFDILLVKLYFIIWVVCDGICIRRDDIVISINLFILLDILIMFGIFLIFRVFVL